MAPLHRAQPAQPDHDRSPEQEQGPLEPPTMRTHTFRHTYTSSRRGEWAWRGCWRRRRGGWRHPLIFLLYLRFFIFLCERRRGVLSTSSFNLQHIFSHCCSENESTGWKLTYFMRNGSLCWSRWQKPCRKNKKTVTRICDRNTGIHMCKRVLTAHSAEGKVGSRYKYDIKT